MQFCEDCGFKIKESYSWRWMKHPETGDWCLRKRECLCGNKPCVSIADVVAEKCPDGGMALLDSEEEYWPLVILADTLEKGLAAAFHFFHYMWDGDQYGLHPILVCNEDGEEMFVVEPTGVVSEGKHLLGWKVVME